MKVLSSQLGLRFKQSQLCPKNLFGASTEFDCSYIVNRLISIPEIAITAAMITPSFHLYLRSSLNIHNNKKEKQRTTKKGSKVEVRIACAKSLFSFIYNIFDTQTNLNRHREYIVFLLTNKNNSGKDVTYKLT